MSGVTECMGQARCSVEASLSSLTSQGTCGMSADTRVPLKRRCASPSLKDTSGEEELVLLKSLHSGALESLKRSQQQYLCGRQVMQL